MIRFVSMTSHDFAAFVAQTVPSYAEDNVKSGRWPAQGASARAAKVHAELLPQGVRTPDHHFYVLCREGDDERVGYLWVKVEETEKEAFIYQLLVFPEHRRKGYAAAAIKRLAAALKTQGCQRLGLHVFGFNAGAIALYKKVGFEVTSLNMLYRL